MKQLRLMVLMASIALATPLFAASPVATDSRVTSQASSADTIHTQTTMKQTHLKETLEVLGVTKESPSGHLLSSLNSQATLKPSTFYNTFLLELGYQAGVDYKATDSLVFARQIGLNPYTDSTFSQETFESAVTEILKASTKDGQDYFDLCLERGFLADYNADKVTPEPLVFDGKTRPIFDYNEVIYEKVYVESPQDTDQDGKRDLLEVWIKRPKETTAGMKVPVLFELSPYERGTNDDLYTLHGVDEDLSIGTPSPNDVEAQSIIPAPRPVKGLAPNGLLEKFDFTGWYDYFLPRGYAVVSAGGLGTLGSEGMVLTGSEDEITAGVAIINWLTGNGRAFTNKTDNIEVKADWCNGNVGMSGRSYRGTLPIGIAATGVEGLKTIVPVAAISNWYDYYRANGLNLAAEGWQGDDIDLLSIYCMSRMLDSKEYASVAPIFEKAMADMLRQQDRITGDYNAFWDERNYLNNADQIDASVMIVHGLRDWNVKPKQFDMLWRELEKYDVPRKMVLHQGEHMSIDNLMGLDFNDLSNRWFDHWLYEIENDVMTATPKVLIQNNTSLDFEGFDQWPLSNDQKTFYIGAGTLSTTPIEGTQPEIFVDDLSLSGFDRENPDFNAWRDTLLMEPITKRPDRLAYLSKPLPEATRISGTVDLAITASLDAPTGILSAMLVDYGQDLRPTIATEVKVPNGISYGGNAGTSDWIDFVIEDTPSPYRVISRGWMEAQNYTSIAQSTPLIPGKSYTFKFSMEPMDYTVKAGHRLGLIILSTDADFTTRPLKTTTFTVDPTQTTLTLPIVQ
ncbi:MAG: Xaa-Pro dipeptidyl-peptidase [Cellulosilyticaceae bacterium]